MAAQIEISTLMRERCAKAYEMREQGKTFSQIGEALEVSGNRARQICRQHESIKYKDYLAEQRNKEEEKLANAMTIYECCDWFTATAVTEFKRLGYETKEQIESAFINRELHSNTPLVGEQNYKVIVKWLGHESWCDEVTARLFNILKHGDYHCKEHVKRDFISGKLEKDV